MKGDGFFVVRTPQGDAYTRNGNFTKGDNNVLTTQEGYPVIGKSGNPITANVNEFDVKSIKIYPNGNVEINNEVVDAIRIVDFNDKKNMEHLGNSLFRPLNNQVPVDSNNFEVTQGAIELSNANVVESMVNTINAMRSYETMAKMVETESRSIAKTVGEVGRLKR
ncbi:MAG: hypothetical protein MZV64_27015 [Ignavibacteriales bacterium]|nr:hypothetical protein [Ignavibacteriales bacterium]